MNGEIKARWIEALTSGSYAQGRHSLRSAGDKYCCLGVLCDIAVQDGHGEWYDLPPRAGNGPAWHIQDHNHGFSGAGLTQSVMNWAGVEYKDQDSLILMNDMEGASFEDIAEWIGDNL